MMDKKIHISFDGVITKLNQEEFTTEEYENLVDELLNVVDKWECGFGGGVGLHTEKEYEEILDNK